MELLSWFALIAVWLCAAPAIAADGGRAAQLFEEAQALLSAGDFAAACAKLEESQQLDPQLGTKLHLANCYEKRGLIASAYLNFRAAAEWAAQRNAAGQSEPREAVARRRAAALQERLSTLQLHIEQPETPGLRIEHDAQALDRAGWSAALPVDPGTHLVRASAPGRRDFRQSYSLNGERARTELTVPALLPLPVEETSGTRVPEAPPPSAANAAATSGRGIQRLAGFVLAGVGVVGLGVGGVFGLLRNAKVSDMEAACGSPCNVMENDSAKLQSVHALRADASTYATTATLGFVIGAAALVGGVVLVLTSPTQHSKQELAVGVTPNGLSVRGRLDAL